MLLSLVKLTACDQPKSGPVQPEAIEPTQAVAQKTATTGDLFSAQGPQTSVAVGSATPIELSVTPSAGFKINKLYTWSFEFHPNDAVDFASTSVKMDGITLDDARATIPLSVTAKRAGDHVLTATANFSVCNDDKCELYRDREVAFKLAATDG